MNPEQFLQSVYLGDRACKAILIDSWKRRVAIQVDCISRLKPGSQTWDFYTDADINDGWLVFTGVSSVRLTPSGPLPNDFIEVVSVERFERPGEQPVYQFELSAGSGDEGGNLTELRIEIEASWVHLEDPARPGVEISE